ncbi:outer membrane protein assembly factor BamD [Agaribacterium sp. ZY112]|uniref:outer membrane protein assembly factor BamD n=1 Tax=Agaribacterium sp. ZY112 TaxID=3233574 RepID=UPI0035254A54
MPTYLSSNPIVRTLLWLSFCATLLTSCSTTEDYGRGTEQEVFERAQHHMENSSWQVAIETLQALEENFPFGTYAEQAQLELIYAYYKAGEFQAALITSERFIRLHPQHRNVDYAYYMRGISSFYNDSVFSSFFPVDTTLRDPGTAKESFHHFSELLNNYPQSPYALDAEKRMIFLRNTLARGEINVANYYFKRGAYLAAANRGRWVVENMQGTPAVPDGLATMAQAYHLIDMQPLSEDAIKVLNLNYPDYPALKNGGFDYQYGSAQGRSWVSYVTFGIFDKRPTIKFDTRKQYNPYYLKNKEQSENSPALTPPAS